MVEKLFERALKTDLALDGFHLFADRRDLLQPQFVNLLGGQVGGRRILEPVGIIGLAVGEAPHAEVALRFGLDLVDRGDQHLIAVFERPGQRRGRIGDQLRLDRIGGIERADFFAEIAEQGRIRSVAKRSADEDFLRIGARGREIDLVGHRPGGCLLAHRRRDLAHHAVGIAQTRDIGLGVGDRIDLVIVDQQHRDIARRAAVGRYRKTKLAEPEGRTAALDVIFEQSVADARARSQLFGPKARAHFLQLSFEQFLFAHRGGVGIIVEPVVIALEPELRLAFGLKRDPRVESVVEKAEQRFVLRRRWRRLGHRGGGKNG